MGVGPAAADGLPVTDAVAAGAFHDGKGSDADAGAGVDADGKDVTVAPKSDG